MSDFLIPYTALGIIPSPDNGGQTFPDTLPGGISGSTSGSTTGGSTGSQTGSDTLGSVLANIFGTIGKLINSASANPAALPFGLGNQAPQTQNAQPGFAGYPGATLGEILLAVLGLVVITLLLPPKYGVWIPILVILGYGAAHPATINNLLNGRFQ